MESGKIIGGLARIVRDVGLAEELAQDTLLTALERWPESGIPDNPGAWLMAAAKNRALDHFRRNKLLERKHEELGRELELQQQMAQVDFDQLADALASEPSLRGYHLLSSVRGDLLFKLGRFDEARGAFEHAATLTLNVRERKLLLERAVACAPD